MIRTIAAADGAEFSCFVADRDAFDPVARFGSPWVAYEKLATQLLIGSVRPGQLLSVLADNYSTPDHVMFEQDVRKEVNRRLRRLAVVTVCRLDSRAADPLQLVDLLTSAVTHEFRQSAGLAGSASPKAHLAAELRSSYGVESCMSGCEAPALNVKLYREE